MSDCKHEWEDITRIGHKERTEWLCILCGDTCET